MIWVGVAGFVITVVALLARSLTVWNRPPFGYLRDTDQFRREYKEWEPLVFERFRTIRSIKRFGNRARFLVADHAEGMVSTLVGFVALEELGIDDVSRDDFIFDDWKQRDWSRFDGCRLSERCASRIAEWSEDITEDDVQIYRRITTGPRTLDEAQGLFQRADVLVKSVDRVLPRQVSCAEEQVIRSRYRNRSARSAQGVARASVDRPVVVVRHRNDVVVVHQLGWPGRLDTIGIYDARGRRARLKVRKLRSGVDASSFNDAVRAAPENALFDILGIGAYVRRCLGIVPAGSTVILRGTIADNVKQARAIRRLCRRRRLTVAAGAGDSVSVWQRRRK